MNCEKCGIEHDGQLGSGRFCSNKCAFGRVFSEATKIKKRNSALRWQQEMRENEPEKWAKLKENTKQRMIKARAVYIKNKKDKWAGLTWDELGIDARRSRVLQEQSRKCLKCSLSEWFGQKLVLELEHKDGNHQNNSRDNLEGLCPNCHSITDTWRGKNKSMRGRVSDEELSLAIQNTKTIRQALIAVGMSPRGKNYVRAKRLSAILLSH